MLMEAQVHQLVPKSRYIPLLKEIGVAPNEQQLLANLINTFGDKKISDVILYSLSTRALSTKSYDDDDDDNVFKRNDVHFYQDTWQSLTERGLTRETLRPQDMEPGYLSYEYAIMTFDEYMESCRQEYEKYMQRYLNSESRELTELLTEIGSITPPLFI